MSEIGIEPQQSIDQALPDVPPPREGLRRDSVVRLAADLLGLVTGMAVAVITARALGPEGKGTLASLTLLAMLFFRCASLGLGDSAVVLVGKGAVAAPQAFRSNLGLTLVSSPIAGLLFLPVGALLIKPDAETWTALALAAVLVPLGALQDISSRGLIMAQAIVRSSSAVACGAVATLLATAILVPLLDLGVVGAVLAVGVGGGVGLGTCWAFLPRSYRRSPQLRAAYLSRGIRMGLWFEASNLITIAAGRIDLLVVLALLGEASAGRYSVALTVGAIVALVPLALSYATFPRIAYSDAEAARHLALRSWRVSGVAALATGAVLAVATPFVIPIAFGSAFQGAVIPSLLLILGSALAGGQWTLARALAAEGRPRMLLGSFTLSLLTMVTLDLLLIPVWGLSGAAIASAIGNFLGILFCMHVFRAQGATRREFIPTAGDVVDVVQLGRSAIERIRHPRR